MDDALFEAWLHSPDGSTLSEFAAHKLDAEIATPEYVMRWTLADHVNAFRIAHPMEPYECEVTRSGGAVFGELNGVVVAFACDDTGMEWTHNASR